MVECNLIWINFTGWVWGDQVDFVQVCPYGTAPSATTVQDIVCRDSWVARLVQCLPRWMRTPLFHATVVVPRDDVVAYTDKKHNWTRWWQEITTGNKFDHATQHFVLAGRAPAAFWMLLGNSLYNLRKGYLTFTIVNIHIHTQQEQIFCLPTEASAESLASMRIRSPAAVGGADVGVVYVHTNEAHALTPNQAASIETLFPRDRVAIWVVQPASGSIVLNSQTVAAGVEHVRTVVDTILASGCRTIALATSAVDAMAFGMGTTINPHAFEHVYFLHFDGHEYDIGMELHNRS